MVLFKNVIGGWTGQILEFGAEKAKKSETSS